MDLNDFNNYNKIDRSGMIGHIKGLPDQLSAAWTLGQTFPIPNIDGLRHIIISGMGGSAIAGDMLAGYAKYRCLLPIFILRDYDLPSWAYGPETLVIACSHSGNTEETLSVFEHARNNSCRIVTLSRGGALTAKAKSAGFTAWTFEHDGAPRSAVGFSFGLLLALFFRTGLLPDPSSELHNAVQAMNTQERLILPEIPVEKNTAKQLAIQLINRHVVIIGSNYLEPIARRWKCQINELAKAWAQFEALPEADHNSLAGSQNPENIIEKTAVVFLQSPSDHPRNSLRAELTRQELMVEGFTAENYRASGDNPMSHIWTALHFGDYLSYYMAMAYQIDPTPILSIENLKKAMKK